MKEYFFIVHKVQNSLFIKELLKQLHLGEAEVLCFCMKNNVKLCLMDDNDARIFATLKFLLFFIFILI
ncbi:hypothetical protein GMMP15_1580014 [Candidatus Magnetomoraceae bacterium gMMP-15]